VRAWTPRNTGRNQVQSGQSPSWTKWLAQEQMQRARPLRLRTGHLRCLRESRADRLRSTGVRKMSIIFLALIAIAVDLRRQAAAVSQSSAGPRLTRPSTRDAAPTALLSVQATSSTTAVVRTRSLTFSLTASRGSHISPTSSPIRQAAKSTGRRSSSFGAASSWLPSTTPRSHCCCPPISTQASHVDSSWSIDSARPSY
jgi:hypothetical protein